MSQFALESFGGYKKARELFDLVVHDMTQIKKEPLCYRLVAQQVASADSICANIEEGHGRLSRGEYIRLKDEDISEEPNDDVFPSSPDPQP